MKKILVITTLLCSLLVTSCQANDKKNMSNATGNKTKQEANGFDLKDINGKEVTLSDFKGKKLYVKFWASWCPICLSGLDELATLSTQKHDFKVVSVVAPGVNGEKNTKDFIQWFKGLKMSGMEVLLDEGGTYTSAMHVRGYPTSAFYDTKGTLVQIQPGHLNNDAIVKKMKNIK